MSGEPFAVCVSPPVSRSPSTTPDTIARDGSSGVLGTFHTRTSPEASSTRQMSVKVPPESTPTRHIARGLYRLIPSTKFSHLKSRRTAMSSAVVGASDRPPADFRFDDHVIHAYDV